MNLTYYSTHSPFTDPGPYQSCYRDLPTHPGEIVQVIQGILIHKLVADEYHVHLSPIQKGEQHLRTVQQRLARMMEISTKPLSSARAPADREVGTCRDFALLMVSMLRNAGIPARMRVGFAKYLDPDGPNKVDHWITEYWDADHEGWILADAQIDPVQREAFRIQTDALNLRRDQDFYSAGSAWFLCRSGKEKSTFFRFSGRWKGFPCIRGNLLHDFQALNKIELSPFDFFDQFSLKADTQLTVEDKALLDRIAELTINPDQNLEALQDLFSALPGTKEIYSRLETLGIETGFWEESGQAQGLTGVDRLVEITLPPVQEKRKILPTTYVPYDIPLDSGLAHMAEQEIQNELLAGDIVVRGARQHNLKHINVRIPRFKFVVITGVSGSGKSSLAFDTIYAEGQRRYVESLSSYARQFMGLMDKPQVDQITGLSPAIAIEQKTVSRNPRSTVGTVTEVLDYLRVLFARLGTPHCPKCGRAVQPQSAQQIANQLSRLPAGKRFQLLAPLATGRKGTHASLLKKAREDGFTRVRINGEELDFSGKKITLPELDKNKKHHIEVVVDRLIAPGADSDQEYQTRLMDSVETTLKAGSGVAMVDLGDETIILSEHNACPVCDLSFPELQPPLFSFNSPFGMCPDCNGLGVQLQVDPRLVVSQPELSLLDGASGWYRNLRKKGASPWHIRHLQAVADYYGVDLEKPWQDLPESFQNIILYGSGDEKVPFRFETDDGSFKGESLREVKGAVFDINRLFRQTKSEYTRHFYMQFMSQLPCSTCHGERLCAEARFVTVGGKRLPELTSYSIEALHDWIQALPGGLDEEQTKIGSELIEEIRQRLGFMRNVGLHYLNLDRPAPTLSGGEGQRIRLASQIGSGLVGVLYILDEPSIGLHARDHRALLDTLGHLRDLGNTVLVVEHDSETMRVADWLVDLGPGPGILGGEVVAAGTPEEVMDNPDSLTGKYLSGELEVTAPNGNHRRPPTGWLTVVGARLHNLKNITARFPLGTLVCVTGVSGSGKSSLISHTLFPALDRVLHHAQMVPGEHDRIDGLERVDKVINITQEPIGRNPRSNPGTYVGVLNEIRKVFAVMPEAKALGFKPDRFSFNVKGGRCEACAGYGYKRVEMHFLPDVWVRCKECNGKRFNRQTLAITYKGKNIADVLDMDVQEAMQFFANHPDIYPVLQTLEEVGLDYLKLGQSALTLSGGEAQRIKLSKELSRASTGKTVYILDEPTTGLHFADIQKLLDVLHRLVDCGNTVIVIEHNLDVIKTADWIIDLGPEGGDQGGYIVTEGTPEEVAMCEKSHTAKFLKELFEGRGK
jgi:excinuclease ABC subunit A